MVGTAGLPPATQVPKTSVIVISPRAHSIGFTLLNLSLTGYGNNPVMVPSCSFTHTKARPFESSLLRVGSEFLNIRSNPY